MSYCILDVYVLLLPENILLNQDYSYNWQRNFSHLNHNGTKGTFMTKISKWPSFVVDIMFGLLKYTWGQKVWWQKIRRYNNLQLIDFCDQLVQLLFYAINSLIGWMKFITLSTWNI